MRPLPFFALVSLSFALHGCTGGKDTGNGPDGDADADADSDTDTDADSDTDTDADLADIREAIVASSDGCEDLAGAAVDGAKEYFWGEYSKASGSDWVGQEAIYYYANATWKSHGGADCAVVWDMTATETACSGCELGLSVSATLNVTESTCPSQMYQGDETFTEDYAIDEATDGTSTWHFATSGTEFGAGYWVAGAANYLSDSSCAWF